MCRNTLKWAQSTEMVSKAEGVFVCDGVKGGRGICMQDFALLDPAGVWPLTLAV